MNASILLVDDEESILKSMKFALIKEGYKITTATCGEEAVELVKSKGEKFDLIITDLQMSGIGGIEVLKEVKTMDPLAPVIILTAYGTVNSVTDAKRLGISDFLIKPVNNAELSARVSHCIERHAMQKEIGDLKSKLAEYENKLKKYEKPD